MGKYTTATPSWRSGYRPRLKAKPFTVTIMWFEGNGLRKRRFRKYIEAVEWANKYINTDEIVVRIIGTIEKEEGANGN